MQISVLMQIQTNLYAKGKIGPKKRKGRTLWTYGTNFIMISKEISSRGATVLLGLFQIYFHSSLMLDLQFHFLSTNLLDYCQIFLKLFFCELSSPRVSNETMNKVSSNFLQSSKYLRSAHSQREEILCHSWVFLWSNLVLVFPLSQWQCQ